jgi:hypothetical protein
MSEVPTGNWQEETEITDMGEFDALCAKAFALDAEIDADKERIKEKSAQHDALLDQITNIMKKHNKQKYLVDGVGTISINQNYSWRVPQTVEAKKAFFDYLKKEGVLMEMVTVNSNTLNSFCKAQLKAVLEKDANLEWNPPGLEAPTHYEKVSMRRAKK